jgi:dihydrofolate synthase/folylpolyglutamate synthase
MQSLAEAVRYLYSLGNEVKTIKLGLERIQTLLAALGHPERACPVIHIAGTNGKGSVSAMVESTLRHAGCRTGLYTSPHLVTPQERIRVNGEAITEEDFLAAFAAVHHAAETLTAAGRIDMHPTYFETITAMGFWHFRQARVERLVLEVGLGGRLDATNVVDPLLSIITPIDYDHQQYLGDTLPAIAREKAGIIKPGRPVVLAPQPPEARPVFPAGVIDVADWHIEHLEETPEGCTYTARLGDTTLAISCPLPGPHQVINSLTAAVALHTLGLDESAIRRGIAATRWPGRLEIIRRDPLTYLDGAHNPGAARSLRQFIEKHFPGKMIWLVFGVMRDKDVPAITRELFPLASRLILTRANQDRSLEPETLAACAPPEKTVLTPSVPAALALLEAAPREAVIFITGSLFVVGEARPLLQ